VDRVKSRPPILQRVEAVHHLVLQMAFDAFVNAGSKEDMRDAMDEHESLDHREFMVMVQQMLDSGQIPAIDKQRVLMRKRWLEGLLST